MSFTTLPIFILTQLLSNTHVAEILLDDTLILPLDDAVALLVIDGRPTKDAFEGEQAYFDLYFFCQGIRFRRCKTEILLFVIVD